MAQIPSPGNKYTQNIPEVQMYIPHLDFIYRLECNMSDDKHLVGAPYNGIHTRHILPISGGTVKGPNISGIIEPLSGADWAIRVQGQGLTRLDARYTLRTDDGHYIYVQSKGIFLSEDPQRFASQPPVNVSQPGVDWFTRLEFEAGPGPYEWMNSIFAVGVLAMHEKRIVIDAYRLTNNLPQAPQPSESS